jgi:hypothetical protein
MSSNFVRCLLSTLEAGLGDVMLHYAYCTVFCVYTILSVCIVYTSLYTHNIYTVHTLYYMYTDSILYSVQTDSIFDYIYTQRIDYRQYFSVNIRRESKNHYVLSVEL